MNYKVLLISCCVSLGFTSIALSHTDIHQSSSKEKISSSEEKISLGDNQIEIILKDEQEKQSFGEEKKNYLSTTVLPAVTWVVVGGLALGFANLLEKLKQYIIGTIVYSLSTYDEVLNINTNLVKNYLGESHPVRSPHLKLNLKSGGFNTNYSEVINELEKIIDENDHLPSYLRINKNHYAIMIHLRGMNNDISQGSQYIHGIEVLKKEEIEKIATLLKQHCPNMKSLMIAPDQSRAAAKLSDKEIDSIIHFSSEMELDTLVLAPASISDYNDEDLNMIMEFISSSYVAQNTRFKKFEMSLNFYAVSQLKLFKEKILPFIKKWDSLEEINLRIGAKLDINLQDRFYTTTKGYNDEISSKFNLKKIKLEGNEENEFKRLKKEYSDCQEEISEFNEAIKLRLIDGNNEEIHLE